MAHHRELVAAGYAALDARDQEAFLALIHPDAEFTSLVAEAEGQTFRTHAEAVEALRARRSGSGGVAHRSIE